MKQQEEYRKGLEVWMKRIPDFALVDLSEKWY